MDFQKHTVAEEAVAFEFNFKFMMEIVSTHGSKNDRHIFKILILVGLAKSYKNSINFCIEKTMKY